MREEGARKQSGAFSGDAGGLTGDGFGDASVASPSAERGALSGDALPATSRDAWILPPSAACGGLSDEVRSAESPDESPDDALPATSCDASASEALLADARDSIAAPVCAAANDEHQAFAAKLCEENLGLAGHCARRFLGRGQPYEELFAQGCAALMQAALRFDPHRGVRFSTYAIPWILGDLRRFCSVRARAAAFLLPHAEPPCGKPDGSAELACSTDGGAVRSALSPLAEDYADPSACFEDDVLLADLLDRLPEPLPTLARLRFWERRSQAEAAQALHMTQASVSRLEARAKALLRQRLDIRAEDGYNEVKTSVR